MEDQKPFDVRAKLAAELGKVPPEPVKEDYAPKSESLIPRIEAVRLALLDLTYGEMKYLAEELNTTPQTIWGWAAAQPRR